MLCDIPNVKNIANWCPPNGVLKFNMDREAKGQPEPEGISGVLPMFVHTKCI